MTKLTESIYEVAQSMIMEEHKRETPLSLARNIVENVTEDDDDIVAKLNEALAVLNNVPTGYQYSLEDKWIKRDIITLREKAV